MNEKRGQYAYEIGHVFSTKHGSMAVIARQKVEKKPDHFRKYYTSVSYTHLVNNALKEELQDQTATII